MTVEAEVKNASGDRATVGLTVVLVDADGQERARFEGDPVDMVADEKTQLTASAPLKDAGFRSTEDPHLYDVYTILTVEGKTVDIGRLATGFQKSEFKGGAGKGGVYLNDKFVYLKGFAQRSAHRVIQNEKPDLHIIGHWTYPEKTVKTIYAIANTQSVEIIVNGKSAGVNSKPENGFVFAFPNIEFAPGSLKAVARNDGKQVGQEELVTAGPPAQIRLTPITGPKGLQADGADVALIDVEVVDAKCNRVPTDDARIDFKCEEPCNWRGGYNSGKTDSTNNLWLNTECGINRVAVRSTTTAGPITVTATREGLKPGQLRIVAH